MILARVNEELEGLSDVPNNATRKMAFIHPLTRTEIYSRGLLMEGAPCTQSFASSQEKSNVTEAQK